MANPTWPDTLPQTPFVAGLSYEPMVDNVLRTAMDAGSPKERRRFSYVTQKVTMPFTLSEAEIATLETFIQATLTDVGVFDWKDFSKTAQPTATYRFLTPRFKKEWLGADLWKVTLLLEMF